jgi:DNA polymerase III subunit delta'
MTAILGQPHALETLSRALGSGRFHHAWIFSGPRGVGKFTTAMEVSRVLLDPQAPRQFPCTRPKSVVQERIDTATHPDLHVIRKELASFSDNYALRGKKQTNIPIDLLRERVIGGKSGETYHEAPAYRTPQMGHGKVFIIDEAELLDPTGQNAMLKTLEEPPRDTYFFLITSHPERLLATIRSRCQHVRFGRLSSAEMKQWVEIARKQLREGAAPFDPASLPWVLQFADGSPGVALMAMEYGFHNWQQTLEPMLAELERGKFPAAMGEALGTLVEEFAQAWVANHGTKTTSKDAANKNGARHMFSLLAAHARNRLAAAVEQRGANAMDWLAVIELISDAERQLDSNVNQKLLMENLVVQWASRNTAAVA